MKESNFGARIGHGDFEERLAMRLSAEDENKIGRGDLWQAVVTDLNTGKRYLTRAASCGSAGCYCDAVATELVVEGRKNPNLLEASKVALAMLQELQLEYEQESAVRIHLPWPEIDALEMAIRLEEGKEARQTKSRRG
jgi:hypothetical protein